MGENHTAVVPSLAFDEARAFGEQAEHAFEVVLEEHAASRPNSSRCRLALIKAAHFRKLAEVHATLAVAEALRGSRPEIDYSTVTYAEAAGGHALRRLDGSVIP